MEYRYKIRKTIIVDRVLRDKSTLIFLNEIVRPYLLYKSACVIVYTNASLFIGLHETLYVLHFN